MKNKTLITAGAIGFPFAILSAVVSYFSGIIMQEQSNLILAELGVTPIDMTIYYLVSAIIIGILGFVMAIITLLAGLNVIKLNVNNASKSLIIIAILNIFLVSPVPGVLVFVARSQILNALRNPSRWDKSHDDIRASFLANKPYDKPIENEEVNRNESDIEF